MLKGVIAILGAVLTFGLAGPAVALANDPDLAGEWHLDSNTGGATPTTPDTSGHGETGFFVGPTLPLVVADGRFSGALSFPAKGSAVDVGNYATLQPANVSVLAWVRATSPPSTVKNIVAQGGQSYCSFASYALYTGGSSQTSGVRFYIHANNTSYATPPAPNSIWDGQWHAVLGTYDGSTVRLYVDGTEVGETPASGAIQYGLDRSNDFWIGDFAGGSNNDGKGCSEQTEFTGDTDEVRVWDRGLTADEAAYVSSRTATTPPELPLPSTTTTSGSTTSSSTPPSPQNVNPPLIRQYTAAGAPISGTYICTPGRWLNLPSPPSYGYRWIATENGKPVPVGQGQTYAPTNATYGYPVSCEVTVQGPTRPISATSSSVFFTAAGLNQLPPAYGDVRVKGIDVFQVVQPNAGALAYSYPSGTFGVTCGGGTPTPYFRGDITNDFLCTPGRDNPQQAMQQTDYQGVKLDSDKTTAALVYLNTVDVPPGDSSLPITVQLSGSSNGQSLGDPLVANAPPLQASDSPEVTATERSTPGDFVEFKLPSAWTAEGNLRLTAHVVFPTADFGPSYGAHQCASPNDPPATNPFVLAFFPSPNCDIDDTFTLSKIPFESFTKMPIFQSLQLLTHDQTGFSQTPAQVMAAGRYLYPGGEHLGFTPYSGASIDIDAASKNTVDSTGNCLDANGTKTGMNVGTGGQATRACRQNAVDALMSQWVTQNPARRVLCATNCVTYRAYDAVLGVAHYRSGADGNMLGCAAGSFCAEPGYQHPVALPPNPPIDITQVTATGPTPANTAWLIVDTTVHPVQGAAHELGHFLNLPHAGSNTGSCKNSQLFETWPGDDSGRLQGVRFNPVRGWRANPQVDNPSGRVLYDLMTYCADFADRRPTTSQTRAGVNPAAYPGDSWLSARNWNHVISVLATFAQQPGAGSVGFARDTSGHAARPSATPFAVGAAGPSGGSIDRVLPSDGQSSVPASVPASPYRLRSLGTAGRILLDAGVTPQPSEDIRGASAGTFVGPVANGATAVQLLYNGRVLAVTARSKPPKVKLALPRRGIHLRRGQNLGLSWHSSDPDTKTLQATVDVSADGGRTWRTAYLGPNNGRVSLPVSALAASRKTRARVTVNDGFSVASSTSPTFTAPGFPPQAQIIAPVSGDTVLAGQRTRLVATAMSDRGQPLTGRSLTWYAGRTRLGYGATLQTRLPGGRVTLSLVATGSGGNIRTVTERLTVIAQRLRITALSVPQRVKQGSKKVTIVLRTSTPSKLSAGRQRYAVRTRSTRITLSLPSKPAIGVVKVPFTLSPSSRSVTGTIRGSVWVVRT